MRIPGTGGVVGPHYASSKAALHGLIHWIAQRYARDGIVRASAVLVDAR
jgi:NAD(P)-dependent dehydrogenase (short-subunit alcohol dehydrogenase family)